jgi:hypothetical protein
MKKRRSSKTSSLIFLLCICIGSMIAAPLFQVVGVSAMDVFELGSEQVEFDEEICTPLITSAASAGQIYSKCGSTNLRFQPASLLPVVPPPKYF